MTEENREHLKERVYLLLYGLLDEKEAEELRLLVATNPEAGLVYESARATIELFRDFTIATPLVDSVDGQVGRNIAVEPRSAVPFAFDSVVSSFERKDVLPEAPDSESESVDKNEGARSKKRKKSHRRKKKGKRNKKKGSHSSGDMLLRQDTTRKNQRKSAFVDGFIILLKAVDANVCQFFKLLWRSPIFSGFLVTLLILLGAVVFGAMRRDHLLARYFLNDFRIQVAAPRTLARGASQSIVVRTTGVDGRPRRVPVRFSFSAPETSEHLLAHTESGNSDGNLVYALPDLSDFPDSVELTIDVGADEIESFKTRLTVVNYEDRVRDCRYVWTQPNAVAQGDPAEFARVSPIFRLALESLTSVGSDEPNERQLSEATDEDETVPQSSTESASNSIERVFVQFYPETGRLIAGFPNRVHVFCSDKDGRPLARTLTLFQENVKNPIATFTTSPSGFAFFDWTPVEKAIFAVALDNEGSEEEQSPSNPFAADLSLIQINRREISLQDSPATVEIDPASGRRFSFFRPYVAHEPAYFALKTLTPDFTKRLDAALTVNSGAPLVVTVEKYGVTMWQRFLSASKNDGSIELPLPDSLSGLLRVSLYSVAQRKFQKISETTIFRFPPYAATPKLSAELVESAPNSGARRLVANYAIRATDRKTQDSFWKEEKVKADVYWIADRKNALAFLDVDDALANLHDEVREEIVKTTPDSLIFNPPVVFDNLERLVKNAHEKLALFKEQEERSFLWTIRFVFVSYLVIALASLFFAVFRAFSFSKCALICVLAGGLFVYTHGLQTNLDMFFRTSQGMFFAIDNTENQLANLETVATKDRIPRHDTRPDAQTPQDELPKARFITSSELSSGVAEEFDIDELLSGEERTNGALLLKLDGAVAQGFEIVPLADEAAEEPTP
jgi:hypothetical protein